MTFDLREPPRRRSRLARLALAFAWFSVLVALYAFALIRLRLVEPFAAFAAFASGLGIAVIAILLGAAALVVVWTTGLRGGVRAVAAIAIALSVLAGPAYVAARGFGAPVLNDVATDLADPPAFTRAVRDRTPGDLPVPGPIPPEQAERLRAAYGDLQPLKLSQGPDEVSNLVIALVEERGWRTLGPTAYPRGGPPLGRVEAVARTPVLGFEDDVVIRVREDGTGSRVDMRSASRLGRGDFGANAERIRSFLADLKAAAGGG